MNYVIWVTTDCNMKCKYCYEGQNKKHLKLDKKKCDDIVKYIIKSAGEDKNITISFHGGEPLLAFENIKYLVNKLNTKLSDKKVVSYAMTTNATLLNEKIIEFLVREITDLTVSIDGDKKMNDINRLGRDGKSYYERVYKNALLLNSKFNNLRIRMTVNHDNCKYLFNGTKKLIDDGFLLIVPGIDEFDNHWTDNDFIIIKDQILMIKNYLKDKKKVTVSLCEKINISECSFCKVGENNRVILPDGNIYPCTLVGGNKEFLIGNIYDDIDKEKVSMIKKYNYEDYEDCLDCALYNVCTGRRCKIINKIINQDYVYPSEVNCTMNGILFELNGWKEV